MQSDLLTMSDKLNKSSRKSAFAIPKFVAKLFELLENGEFGEYVSWSDDGTALVIKDSVNFAKEVLPKFFKHNKFLLLLDSKLNKTGYELAYSHPSFQRGRREALPCVIRQTNSCHSFSKKELSNQLHRNSKMNDNSINSSEGHIPQKKSADELLAENETLGKYIGQIQRELRELNLQFQQARVQKQDLVSRYQDGKSKITQLKQFFLMKYQSMVSNKSQNSARVSTDVYREDPPYKKLHRESNNSNRTLSLDLVDAIDYSQQSQQEDMDDHFEVPFDKQKTRLISANNSEHKEERLFSGPLGNCQNEIELENCFTRNVFLKESQQGAIIKHNS